MKKLRYGIVGCGGISTNKHMPALKTLSEYVEMVAFCDIIIERAENAAKEFGVGGKGEVFSDYKELLKLDLDAVCVCTPNISHCEITVAALNSGKHVMCEKPMSMNYAEAKKMMDAQKKSGKLLTIGYQNRYRPDTRYLKSECAKNVLGEVYFAKAHAIRRRAVPTWGVFLDKEKQGGGPLIDIGTHALDLALFMMNNYEPLYAVGTTFNKLNNDTQTGNMWGDWDPKKFTVEDSAFGFVVMKNGATVFLESSWALNSIEVKEASVTLCGTKAGATTDGKNLTMNSVKNGTLVTEIPDFNTGGVAFYGGGEEKIEVVEAKTFINAILGKGELCVLPNQAAQVTRILEGIYESAKTGKPHYFD